MKWLGHLRVFQSCCFMAEYEILNLYKKVGETPLECIYRFKTTNSQSPDRKMTYLGRLDPMAEGVMLVMVGSTKKKEEFLGLDKDYEFEVLWGFNTDTYDVLGKVEMTGLFPQKLDMKMDRLLETIRKKKVQKYPPYSSRTVGGKPLFEWARENRIGEIDVPERGIRIFSIDHIYTRLVSGREILEDVTRRVGLVNGDFRQKEILGLWAKALENSLDEQFMVSAFKASVSSGTYIRSLAEEMGKVLGCGALAYSIKRTRVGDYS